VAALRLLGPLPLLPRTAGSWAAFGLAYLAAASGLGAEEARRMLGRLGGTRR
jgi:hypothetical protein